MKRQGMTGEWVTNDETVAKLDLLSADLVLWNRQDFHVSKTENGEATAGLPENKNLQKRKYSTSIAKRYYRMSTPHLA